MLSLLLQGADIESLGKHGNTFFQLTFCLLLLRCDQSKLQSIFGALNTEKLAEFRLAVVILLHTFVDPLKAKRIPASIIRMAVSFVNPKLAGSSDLDIKAIKEDLEQRARYCGTIME